MHSNIRCFVMESKDLQEVLMNTFICLNRFNLMITSINDDAKKRFEQKRQKDKRKKKGF